MLKTILNMLAGAIIAASVGTAYAVIGTPPGTGFELIDGAWLNGFAGGHNRVSQSGLSAAGTTQATSTQLPTRIALMQVDTTAANSGVALPPALSGMFISLYNNGASTLTVYPSIANNPVTAAQDTINSATSFSGGVATHVTLGCFAAKTGVWACK